MALSKELVAASTTPLILSLLTSGESYGYAIIQRVRQVSGGAIEWTDGMLYPVLHRLEKQKLIRSEWRRMENGRKRKYYSLTGAGADVLAQQQRRWILVDSTLRTLWNDPNFSSNDS